MFYFYLVHSLRHISPPETTVYDSLRQSTTGLRPQVVRTNVQKARKRGNALYFLGKILKQRVDAPWIQKRGNALYSLGKILNRRVDAPWLGHALLRFSTAGTAMLQPLADHLAYLNCERH